MVQPMTVLTKADLRDLYGLVTALQPPGRAVSLAEVVRAGELAGKIATMVAEHRAVLEKGALVLSWRIAKEHALKMNAYAGQRRFMLGKIKKTLDDQLRVLLEANPAAALNVAQRQRWIRATRFSTQQPDEPDSCDSIGCKQPIDALVRAGVLVDDNPKWLKREARWEKCKPGGTHLLLEVFDVTTEGGDVPEPLFVPAPVVKRKTGPMMKMMKEANDVR